MMVKNCPTCAEFRHVPREPLVSTALPERPWWRLAVDLFEFREETYICVVDYYSRFIVADRLENSEAITIVKVMRRLFTLMGVPNSLVSDNGPQFTSLAFKDLMRTWDVTHYTSSPRNPQSNGAAERAVQNLMVKAFLKKNVDLQTALLHYRDTPLQNGLSPAQLLFNRPLNSIGILKERQLDPELLKDRETAYRRKQANTIILNIEPGKGNNYQYMHQS